MYDQAMTTQTEGYRVPQWTFGDRLRKIRKEVGLNQVDFAKRIDRGDKAVASWELGTNEPRDIVAVARRIEVAFGVPAAWTLGVETTETPRPSGPGEAQQQESRPYIRSLMVAA